MLKSAWQSKINAALQGSFLQLVDWKHQNPFGLMPWLTMHDNLASSGLHISVGDAKAMHVAQRCLRKRQQTISCLHEPWGVWFMCAWFIDIWQMCCSLATFNEGCLGLTHQPGFCSGLQTNMSLATAAPASSATARLSPCLQKIIDRTICIHLRAYLTWVGSPTSGDPGTGR